MEEPPAIILPPEGSSTNTEHGLLVAFGKFLRQHGLLDRLRQVPVPQKTQGFKPQDKLIEFLAGITPHLRLARCEWHRAFARPQLRTASLDTE